jgi:hydrogenase/urease accessory protein HupE
VRSGGHRQGRSTALGALLLLCAAAPASAHTYAASAFEAFTDGRDVRFDFRLDATSVLELSHRAHPQQAPIERAGIEGESPLLLAYMGQAFTVSNDGAACPPVLPARVMLHVPTDKVVFSVVYRCGADLDRLTLRSTIFNEETTPHQIIGSFHHRRALEHYFLTAGMKEALIDVPRLAQVLPAESSGSRQFHMATPPPGAFAPRPRGGFATFVGQGVQHILSGIDHLLFIVSLLIVIRDWKRLAAVVTSFTLAHSVTLAVGALGLVRLSPRLVEPMIALTIIYVAVENVLRLDPRARLGVTFAFGLVHGFGFSSVLRDLGLARGQLVPALVGFNLGVELGQLLVVAPLFPLVIWLQRHPGAYRRVRLSLNASVAVVACWWFVQRLMGSVS